VDVGSAFSKPVNRRVQLLGRDPNQTELFDSPPAKRYVPTAPQEQRQEPPRPGVGVLSLGEAAARLGVSRGEVEKMIAAGKIKALPTGYTRMIPTSEVERLSGGNSSNQV
jgi:excisionase family DNA binding protein